MESSTYQQKLAKKIAAIVVCNPDKEFSDRIATVLDTEKVVDPAEVERLKAKLLGSEECLETWKSAAEKWEAEVTKLDADLATLHTKVAEAAMIVDRYWTFDDNQQHTHTWHDKQDALAALRSRIKDV